MAITYSAVERTLKPAKLGRQTLADIGQLVRAFAEIEDLVTLYICGLAEITESRALVLLGRSTISTKIEIAQYLAKMTGKNITETHKAIFNADFFEVQKARNAVAHGALLGVTGDGFYAFLTADRVEPDGPSAKQVAICYSAASIRDYAKWAEAAVKMIEKTLKLRSSRGKRLEQPLSPHRNSQQPSQSRDKSKRPPQPQS